MSSVREKAGGEAAPAAAELAQPAPRRRMLVIVNPYATTVSDRLRNLVVYALRSRYEVEAVDTDHPLHATELTRKARDEDFDVVVAFGGDGTVNEVANGLAGSDVPMSPLPGGKTNVFCRTLGIPNDVVDATEHLLALADRFEPRRVDLGQVNDRYFTFSSGIGLDAHVVKRVDQNPKLKTRAGEYYFAWAAITGFYTKYRRDPVRLLMEVPGEEPVEAVTVIVQNSHPFTYFGTRELHLSDGVALDSGTLSMVGLKRAREADVPGVVYRLFTDAPISGHRQIVPRSGFADARVRTLPRAEGEEPPAVPLQVDGDYVGDVTEANYRAAPGALVVVS